MNRKLGNMLFFSSLALPLIPAGALGIAGHGYYYLYTLLAFYSFFGLMEFLSIKNRGQTISADIGDAHREKPVIFWAIIGTWALMCVALIIHWLTM